MNWRNITVLILLMAVTACHHKGPAVSPPVLPPATPIVVAPPPLDVPVADPAPVASRLPYEALALEPAAAPVVVPIALVEGDIAYDSGDFAQAARLYASYLQSYPEASRTIDRVLFQLGVSQSMIAAPKDPAGNDAFNRLIREYPGSSYVAPARMILSLRVDIARLQSDAKGREERVKQLSDELERLKKIDLDRRRTP
jgi:predicted small lipoprotein YifL